MWLCGILDVHGRHVLPDRRSASGGVRDTSPLVRIADLGAFWCALLCCGGVRAQGIVVPGPAPATTVQPPPAVTAPPPGWVLVPAPQPSPPPPPAYAPTYGPAGADASLSQKPTTYDPYLRRPLVVEGHASIGGPYGWVGAAADYSLARMFSLGAGIGLGQSGVQIGGMARFRIAFDYISVGFGAGGSGGPYENQLFLATGYRWTTAYWLNTEGFFEVRSRNGLMVRGYVGSGALLNPGAGICDPQTRGYDDCDGSGNRRQPASHGFLIYTGTAIGYAFSL